MKAQNQLTEEQITEYSKVYNTTKKLPVKQIPCTVTGELTTIFGENLDRRVVKYGTIENLLRTFVSRNGAKVGAPVKEKPADVTKMDLATAKAWAKFYEEKGKLPAKQIPCSVTGTMITIFGENLARRIQNYGSVENLLMNFVSRAAQPKVPKTDKAKKPKKLPKSSVEFIEEQGQVRYDLPLFNPDKPTVKIDLVISGDACRKETMDSCFRPDIYLDNGKACNGCRLFENCAYVGKRMSKDDAKGIRTIRGLMGKNRK
ncbi:MAG: hypothetical protein WCP55_16525 [Lentisphaerota bacterium]